MPRRLPASNDSAPRARLTRHASSSDRSCAAARARTVRRIPTSKARRLFSSRSVPRARSVRLASGADPARVSRVESLVSSRSRRSLPCGGQHRGSILPVCNTGAWRQSGSDVYQRMTRAISQSFRRARARAGEIAARSASVNARDSCVHPATCSRMKDSTTSRKVGAQNGSPA